MAPGGPTGHPALVDAAPQVFWLDDPSRPDPLPPLVGPQEADLVVVGGGYTGLWAALRAKERDPARDVVVLEGPLVDVREALMRGEGRASGDRGGCRESRSSNYRACRAVAGSISSLKWEGCGAHIYRAPRYLKATGGLRSRCSAQRRGRRSE